MAEILRACNVLLLEGDPEDAVDLLSITADLLSITVRIPASSRGSRHRQLTGDVVGDLGEDMTIIDFNQTQSPAASRYY